MKKEIRKLGNSKGVTFSPEELRIYGTKEFPLEEGDIIELEVFLVHRRDDEIRALNFRKDIAEANHQTGALFAASGGDNGDNENKW